MRLSPTVTLEDVMQIAKERWLSECNGKPIVTIMDVTRIFNVSRDFVSKRRYDMGFPTNEKEKAFACVQDVFAYFENRGRR